jgi:hypothetical protein
MTLWFLVLGLIFYGLRYSFSGIDNGLFYAARRGLEPDRDTSLPDIHVGEVLQQWCGHLAVVLLGAAVALEAGKGWVGYGGFLLAMNGASQASTPLFQYYVQEGAGGKQETTHWILPISFRRWRWEISVPKLFANRRTLQLYVGLLLFLIGFTLWTNG